MAENSLRDFVHLLESKGELRRIAVPVDAELEIAAITDRVSKAAGPALFFEQVRGFPWPVATNLFGNLRRMAWALGVEDLEMPAGRLAAALVENWTGNAESCLRNLLADKAWQPQVGPATFSSPTGPADLQKLPALRSWPGDGGRFLTLPMVITRHPETGQLNCGMYRVQIHSAQTATIRFGPHSDGGGHLAAWRERGRAMPIAIALGGDPALMLSAAAPLPAGIDEAAFAGFVRGRPLHMHVCADSDLPVPAGAEFVIEGMIDPGVTALEGPFGNHTGHYALPQPAPLLRVTALHHRPQPFLPATVVGPPPMENCYLAKATERLLLPLLRHDLPELLDINLPLQGIFHGCALVAIRKEHAGQGRAVIEQLWQSTWLRHSRLLVILDEETEVQSPANAYWRAVNQVDPERDILTRQGRLGIDATRKLPTEGGGTGGKVAMSAAMLTQVAQRWADYGLDDEAAAGKFP
jgi:4-hydroxy-3-polyprenylbenzoate decarboxylase